jgi:hypothetical protein
MLQVRLRIKICPFNKCIIGLGKDIGSIFCTIDNKIPLPNFESIHFGLKPSVWTTVSAIDRDKNTVETVKSDMD